MMFNSQGKYYYIETEETGVVVCFVVIHAFIQFYMPDIDPDNFRQ